MWERKRRTNEPGKRVQFVDLQVSPIRSLEYA
jgi:hypothetical protein